MSMSLAHTVNLLGFTTISKVSFQAYLPQGKSNIQFQNPTDTKRFAYQAMSGSVTITVPTLEPCTAPGKAMKFPSICPNGLWSLVAVTILCNEYSLLATLIRATSFWHSARGSHWWHN